MVLHSAQSRTGFFAYGVATADNEGSEQSAAWKERVNTQEKLLQELSKLGFETAAPTKSCASTAEMQDYFTDLNHKRADLGYDIDGAVYKVRCCWMCFWFFLSTFVTFCVTVWAHYDIR